MTDRPRILIIGAGPTGLGAGYRLRELGYDDWTILEAADRVGGLARSFTDDNGFTWDVGGHVMFSHYPYYDRLVDRVMGEQASTMNREAWVWIEDRFVPYPFQNNLRGLRPETIFDCVTGAIRAARENGTQPVRSFRDWIYATMGSGIAEHFMLPYNFKVWATPAELMNHRWIGERVSPIDVEALLHNLLFDKPEKSWGPNNTFRYPLRGGTGFLSDGIYDVVADHVELGAQVVAVDVTGRKVRVADGRTFDYDVLLSTAPIDQLIAMAGSVPGGVADAAHRLQWTGSHIVGIGIDRPADSDKNWIYFPEPDVPFYRVTYLSNYSPHMTPRSGQHSLLAEVSFSKHKKEDPDTVVDRVVDGLVSTGLLRSEDRGAIVSRWLLSPPRSYPVPSLDRDEALATIQPWLREHGIYSRGRFGAWLYEIGNMDHSTMQGVEFVDHVLHGAEESIWTTVTGKLG